MKIIYAFLLFFVLATPAAAEYCYCGAEPLTMYNRVFDGIEDCVPSLKHPTTSFPVDVSDIIAAEHGFCKVRKIGIDPSATQNIGEITDTLNYPYVDRNWTLVDKTSDELNQKTADTMDRNLYLFIKFLLAQGKLTTADVAAAPKELKDAYLAYQALEAD